MGILDLLKMISVVDVDTFIEKATKIIDKVKRNPSLSVEAKHEARVLLGQLEGYLEVELKASDDLCMRLDSTANEEQPIEVPIT